jgi:hypothetical protein
VKVRVDDKLGRLALGVILALALVGEARAQQPPADRAFARDFVAAINSQSLEARLALVHPQARVCTAGEVGEWWRNAVARQAKDPVPATHKASVTELAGVLPFAERFDYPVKATHQLQLDYTVPPNRFRSILVFLAKDGARWTEVVPCAKPETVAAIRANQQARARDAERVKALAARTSPALRDAVIALHKSGRSVEAYQTYARESGEDLATARAVVELLAEGAP